MLRKEDFEPNMKTEDKIPGAQTENPAQSQRFGDFIVKYMQNVQDTMELFPGASFRAINEIFGVLYVPLESMGEIEVTGTSYNSIPKCYTYMDMEAAGESGINRLHDHPYLKLRGKGTAVAVVRPAALRQIFPTTTASPAFRRRMCRKPLMRFLC